MAKLAVADATGTVGLDAGARLSHYRLEKKIGEGGMGAVYRADDTSLKRQVAIKVLFPEFATDTNFVERFRRERQVLADLRWSGDLERTAAVTTANAARLFDV